MLFLSRHALPRGYRTQSSHTWQQWPPFDPNRVYSAILWVDVMTCWKFRGFFSWIFQIVFAIIFVSLHRIQWNFRWKNYKKISFKCFQSQVCAPTSSGAVIFWRFKDINDFWRKRKPLSWHIRFLSKHQNIQTKLLRDLKHALNNYINLLEWKKGQK